VARRRGQQIPLPVSPSENWQRDLVPAVLFASPTRSSRSWPSPDAREVRSATVQERRASRIPETKAASCAFVLGVAELRRVSQDTMSQGTVSHRYPANGTSAGGSARAARRQRAHAHTPFACRHWCRIWSRSSSAVSAPPYTRTGIDADLVGQLHEGLACGRVPEGDRLRHPVRMQDERSGARPEPMLRWSGSLPSQCSRLPRARLTIPEEQNPVKPPDVFLTTQDLGSFADLRVDPLEEGRGRSVERAPPGRRSRRGRRNRRRVPAACVDSDALIDTASMAAVRRSLDV